LLSTKFVDGADKFAVAGGCGPFLVGIEDDLLNAGVHGRVGVDGVEDVIERQVQFLDIRMATYRQQKLITLEVKQAITGLCRDNFPAAPARGPDEARSRDNLDALGLQDN
jgi:hypothetical protein